MIEDWQQGLDWRNGLELLSLDFLRPAYSQLGVGIDCEETVRGLARDALSWRLKSIACDEPESVKGMAAFYSTQVRALTEALERSMGAGAKKRLIHWIQYVACAEAHNPWTLYQESLLSWASDFRRRGQDRIGLATSSAELLARLQRIGDLRDTEQILVQQSRAFLTPWDFPLFKRRGLLDIPEGSKFFPFIDQALLAIDMRRFQVFWISLLSLLSEDQLRLIDAFVRTEGEEAGMEHTRAWDLPLPPIPADNEAPPEQ